jgi:hypothetical protein
LLTTSSLLVVMESRGPHTRQRTKPTIYGSHILEKQPMALQGGSLTLANEWNSFGNDYDSYRIHSDTFRSRLRNIQMALELCQEPPEFIWKHFKHSQRLLKCFRSHSNAFGGYADRLKATQIRFMYVQRVPQPLQRPFSAFS